MIKWTEPRELTPIPCDALTALRMSLYSLTETPAMQRTCTQSLPAACRGVGRCSKVAALHLNPPLVRDSTLW